VAIKRLHTFEEYGEGIPSHVMREVTFLRGFQHPNIMEMLAFSMNENNDFNLVFEYCETDLGKVLKGHRRNGTLLTLQELRNYTGQLLSGVHACFIQGLSHRDLKPQNILVSEGVLKIGDFGLARGFTMPLKAYTHDVVTLWYRAPEIILGVQTYGPVVDIWSAGCVVAEMATSTPLFAAECEIGTLFKIMQMRGTPTEETWPGVTTRGSPNFAEHWRPEFPKWRDTNLVPILEKRPDLMFGANPDDPESDASTGIGLLRRMLMFNPSQRLTSRKAKLHAFCNQSQ
jgi:serine/threonine protein kinase